jgi:hypothetical protein
MASEATPYDGWEIGDQIASSLRGAKRRSNPWFGDAALFVEQAISQRWMASLASQ